MVHCFLLHTLQYKNIQTAVINVLKEFKVVTINNSQQREIKLQ